MPEICFGRKYVAAVLVGRGRMGNEIQGFRREK